MGKGGGKGDEGSEVYSWGQGVLGQLGHGDEKTQRQPRLVVAFREFCLGGPTGRGVGMGWSPRRWRRAEAFAGGSR